MLILLIDVDDQLTSVVHIKHVKGVAEANSKAGVAVHFIPRIFYPGDSISHPGGYTDLSVKYPGSGYFIPGSHLASPR